MDAYEKYEQRTFFSMIHLTIVNELVQYSSLRDDWLTTWTSSPKTDIKVALMLY